MCQPPKVIECMKTLLELEDPATIIEIGTYNGGLTTLLTDIKPDVTIHTFDISPIPENLPKTAFPHQKDVFQYKSEIIKLIRRHGKTILFCDGGDKVREFNEFAPYLKEDDCILGHDFATPGWAWVEITEEEIENAVITNDLVHNIQEIMGQAAWVSYKKQTAQGWLIQNRACDAILDVLPYCIRNARIIEQFLGIIANLNTLIWIVQTPVNFFSQVRKVISDTNIMNARLRSQFTQ